MILQNIKIVLKTKATHRKLELSLLKVVLDWRGTWSLDWSGHLLNGDTRSNQPEEDSSNLQVLKGAANKNTKYPLDAHCHHHYRKDLGIPQGLCRVLGVFEESMMKSC